MEKILIKIMVVLIIIFLFILLNMTKYYLRQLKADKRTKKDQERLKRFLNQELLSAQEVSFHLDALSDLLSLYPNCVIKKKPSVDGEKPEYYYQVEEKDIQELNRKKEKPFTHRPKCFDCGSFNTGFAKIKPSFIMPLPGEPGYSINGYQPKKNNCSGDNPPQKPSGEEPKKPNPSGVEKIRETGL